MLGVHEQQLRAWERLHLIAEADVYSFTQLRALQTLVELRRGGLRPERIRLSMNAAKERLPLQDPLTEAKVFLQGRRRIGVRTEGLVLDPVSGQYLLDFEATPTGVRQVHAIPTKNSRQAEMDQQRRRRREAEDWFQKGLQAEQSGAPEKSIEDFYKKCLDVDPLFSSALVNLGTLHFNRGRHADAEQCYRRAVENDPKYALAHFNLANLHDERGEHDAALGHYLQAIELNPDYGDAHYNVALLYQTRSEYLKAITHWKRYLKLDPGSSWAVIARREMARLREITILEGSRGQ